MVALLPVPALANEGTCTDDGEGNITITEDNE